VGLLLEYEIKLCFGEGLGEGLKQKLLCNDDT
jgi:hypothetical protein